MKSSSSSQKLKIINMEGERGVPNNYELHVSFTNPHHHQAIHEMGFVQFEENQVLSFLAPSTQSQSSSCGGGATPSAPATNGGGGGAGGAVATSVGFSHNDLVTTRTSWNNDQVVYFRLLPGKSTIELIIKIRIVNYSILIHDFIFRVFNFVCEFSAHVYTWY